ncbi:phage terminase large subunit [uncultured Hymenobacter sp.]|uniref:phage terminase large subunit n=1 Tax=uncultured Hymenobacter sp. TaxID=170016 RepID=UPI0035C9D960
MNLLPLDTVIAAQCYQRFYTFFLEMWETIEAVELVPNWHIEYLCDELQAIYERWKRGEAQADVLINIPPGTSKSTSVTQLFPAWLWLMEPSIRTISTSFASDVSIGHGLKSRDCLTSPKFQRLFPGRITFKADENGKTNYRNTANGQRFITSSGARVTGVHADFILIDDPINPEKSDNEKARKQALKHVQTVSSRKTDKKRTVSIMVMQRVHELDPAGSWLKKKKNLHHICLPGELTPDSVTGEVGKNVKPAALVKRYTNGMLDANRLDRSTLATLKEDLGSYGYAGQILQIPAPDEGGILKKAWFDVISWDEFKKRTAGKVATAWQFDADPAYTDKQQNDATGGMASAYIDNTLYVRNASEFRLEFPELCEKLPKYVEAHGYTSQSKLHIEPKASGKSLHQTLKRQTKLNVVEAPAPTDDKRTRVNGISPFCEARRVVLIDGGWVEAFLQQICTFPTAAHDDMLDCLVQAINRALDKKKFNYA